MNFDGVKDFVLNKLRRELEPNLTYHSVEHTMDVMASAERLAKDENVNGTDIKLLKTAALFHDLGFLNTYDGHEKKSMDYAEDVLPKYGYSSSDIEKIKGMIKATEIPQSPTTHLEKILADADLDYIGRDDIFIIGQRLQYEWKMVGKISTLREWHEKQLAFLKKHSFFTQSAVNSREDKKQDNIKQLETLLCGKK